MINFGFFEDFCFNVDVDIDVGVDGRGFGFWGFCLGWWRGDIYGSEDDGFEKEEIEEVYGSFDDENFILMVCLLNIN